jgi:hypothetical protein
MRNAADYLKDLFTRVPLSQDYRDSAVHAGGVGQSDGESSCTCRLSKLAVGHI